jgi:predicted phage gp36 major capsid-like protein
LVAAPAKAALVRSTLAFIADRDTKLGLSDDMRLRVEQLEAQLEQTDEQVVSLQESLERATDALRSRDRALEVRVGGSIRFDVVSIRPCRALAWLIIISPGTSLRG